MKSNAFLVGLGIFLSRIFGLVRERFLAHYFGASAQGDVIRAAMRIPNVLQNLLGEGVLSASFIPVYSELLSKEETKKQAHAVALQVGAILFIFVSLLSLIGVYASSVFVQVLVPGFSADKKELCEMLVSIIFPATGFLVMSAWCLGILNSHKKFFIPYVAPVFWNLSIILVLYFKADTMNLTESAKWMAWGVFIGSVAQFLIQTPFLVKELKWSAFHFKSANLQSLNVIFRNFVPAVLSRGVIQIESYIDNMIASFLVSGSISILSYAQTIYLLPVSLFSMSVSASELPYLSELTADLETHKDKLIAKINSSLKRISYFVIPSSMAFIFLGRDIVALIFLTGNFDIEQAKKVWLSLAFSSVGLFCVTQSRFLNSIFYAFKKTKIPFYISLLRITLGSILTIGLVFSLPYIFPQVPMVGLWGMSFGMSVIGFCEYLILKKQIENLIQVKLNLLAYYFKIFLGSVACGVISILAFIGISHPYSLWVSAGKILLFCILYLIFSFFVKEQILIGRFKKSKKHQ